MRLPHAKIRADEVREKIKDYLSSKPYKIIVNEDSTGTTNLVIAPIMDFPIEISLVIGEVFHTLRSALDNLAIDLVLANGRSTSNVSFPTGKDKKAFLNQLGTPKRNNPGIEKAGYLVVKELLAMELYPGGEGELVQALHSNNILDKHFTPIATAHRVVLNQLEIRTSGGEVILSDTEHVCSILDSFANVSSCPVGCNLEYDEAIVTQLCLVEPSAFSFQSIDILLERVQASVESIVGTFTEDSRFYPG